MSETRADWIEVFADTPARTPRHLQPHGRKPGLRPHRERRVAAGISAAGHAIAQHDASLVPRQTGAREEYQIAVQLRADRLLEETIEFVDDKKEIVAGRQPRTKTRPEAFSSDRPAPEGGRATALRTALIGLSIECSPDPRLRLNDGLYLTPGSTPTPLRPLRSRSIKSLSSRPAGLARR